MSRKMNPHVAFSPSSSQRLWDFLSLANIWPSWQRVILSWGVSSSWAERCHRAPARSWLPSPAPGHCQRVQVPQWVGVLWADRKHHILNPWMDFHCASLLFFPVLTPSSSGLLHTWSERAAITQSFFCCVSVRLSSHCVWLSQSSTSWTVPSGVKI